MRLCRSANPWGLDWRLQVPAKRLILTVTGGKLVAVHVGCQANHCDGCHTVGQATHVPRETRAPSGF